MMYIHYCSKCNSIHILSGHKPSCPACSGQLNELKISFADYTSLDLHERRLLLEQARQACS